MHDPPILRQHDGITVVRDDLYHGGSKARFLPALFDGFAELVYATPPEGGAQTALAYVASTLGKRVTLFVAARSKPHPRTILAHRLGAKVVEVRPGYLSCVASRARGYCTITGARLLQFGLNTPASIATLASAAQATGLAPDEVWCAAGSGVLARALAMAWPSTKRHVVQVGRALSSRDVSGAQIHVYSLPFSKPARSRPSFSSDPHYDAKAWEICRACRGAGEILFWNVTGPARLS